jgi:protein TonB
MPAVKDLKARIFVKFIIEADGSLSEIASIRDISHRTGKEAVRVLKKSSKWLPAEQNGKKVCVMYSLPISI